MRILVYLDWRLWDSILSHIMRYSLGEKSSIHWLAEIDLTCIDLLTLTYHTVLTLLHRQYRRFFLLESVPHLCLQCQGKSINKLTALNLIQGQTVLRVSLCISLVEEVELGSSFSALDSLSNLNSVQTVPCKKAYLRILTSISSLS